MPTIEATDVGDSEDLTGSGHLPITRPFNYLALPSLSVPAGFDRQGLPLSFQLVAKPLGIQAVSCRSCIRIGYLLTAAPGLVHP